METELFDQDKMERKDANLLVSESAQAEEKPVEQVNEFENKDESEREWAKPDDRYLSEMFEPLSMKTAVSADRPEKSMDCLVSTDKSEKSIEGAVSTDKSEKSIEGAVSTDKSEKSIEGAVSTDKSEKSIEGAVSTARSEKSVEGAVSIDTSEKSMEDAVFTDKSENSMEDAVSTVTSENSMEDVVSKYRPKSPEREDVERSALINVTVSLKPKYLIQDSGDGNDASFNKLESIWKEGATNHGSCSNVEYGQHEVENDDGENGQHQINEVTKDIKKQKKDKVSKPNCARASCQNKGRHKCSRCKVVFYCHQDCLGEDWPHHKMFCDYVYEANKVPDDSTRKNATEIENTGDRDEVD